ncbi:bifunctional diaminohydroxyphosphoribosylaminopyrimidine deaminase/5-amino-6-(5-phosphoribosylamino)uracil reductase RibD [Amycolatopsis cihanbeyliensis]|uniref:diaminohydroxyphosphoribosylaminopyrimidine deaminase n=1 Tax=Amycolatopsis cihanbeyliensis TaxID=1128664 RepID=A0A542DPQ4_AMYCI|nr:bifunctional diaminohydroxyphosphoribosylaminopyrimidine deaminase/5-amino-6-(5-phosphoribosylamino)uracil reductase RibD [Amycolatopsis cihanbeyliensis]TQJ05083.1 diaminohydroxyphosphoribosylaminopyrimidine deaminase [Amycolatopsis cihanbeyliensis]
MNAPITEVDAMRRAIALSARGVGTTSPNPPVGCVILDSAGRPVGEGYHLRKGEPHAEVHALTAAGALASGGTAAVTLEPCNHHGRTPPCHQALIDAGVARVLIAVMDPTSRGIGGAARLRHSGLAVEVGVLADEALVVLRPWLTALKTGRPSVTWACDITDGYPRPMPDEVLAQGGLRYQVDAVLYGDGRVEEGLAGGHGQGAVELPGFVPVTEPETALSTLYGAGARTVLLHCGADVARPFAALRLVEDVAMFLATTAPAASSSPSEHDLPLFSPFSIRSIRRLRAGVLVEGSTRSSIEAE